MTEPATGHGTSQPCVVNLCGPFLHVRLVDPEPGDVEAVGARLGLREVSCHEDPDLVLNYLDDAPGVGVGYRTPEGLVGEHGTMILMSDEDEHSTVALSPGGPSHPMDLTTRRSGQAPALLNELASLCTLDRGGLPVHGVGMLLLGRGVVLTGPAGVGKTSVLSAYAALGAQLLASEHLVIAPDGQFHGRRQALRVRPHHRELLRLLRTVSHRERCRLAALQQGRRLAGALAKRGARPVQRLGRRLAEELRERAFVDVDPGPLWTADTPTLYALLLLAPTTGRTVTARELAPDEAAQSLTHLFMTDLQNLLRAYRSYQYLLPGRAWTAVDHAEVRYQQTATEILRGRLTLLVGVPAAQSASRAVPAALMPWLAA